MATDFLLRLVGVKKFFPLPEGGVLPVLNGVGLSLEHKQNIAVVGASGSGKSTLLNLIAGLDSPDSGSVFIEGEDMATLPSNRSAWIRNRKIGYVFQFFNLLPELTVWENIALPMIISGASLSKARKRAYDLLEKLELLSKADYAVNRLSGGEMQRVAILRAIINNPGLILADEPTGNLDSHTAKDVLSFLFKAVDITQGSLVMVTHSLALASKFDKIYELREGILSEVSYEDIHKRPNI